MKKTSTSTSGIFTIKEYILDEGMDFPALIRGLQAGPGEVREVVSYVFSGKDPLGIDARSFAPEEFLQIYPQLDAYDPGLAFDVIVRTEGHPVTVELTEGERTVCTNALDREAELTDLLGPVGEQETAVPPLSEEMKAQGKMSGHTEETDSQWEKTTAQTDPEAGRSMEAEMTPQDLLDILSVAEKLKCNTRHCDTSSGRRESVAEHSWRAALMAMLLSGQREFADYDMDRVIRMCLIHDLGEAFTGDIPAFEKSSSDTRKEEDVLAEWVSRFPDPQRRGFVPLFAEMKEQKTPEARLYKAIDKMEAVIQHNESDLSSWLPLEYDLQLTYGQEEVKCSHFMQALKSCVDAWTHRKIDASDQSENN